MNHSTDVSSTNMRAAERLVALEIDLGEFDGRAAGLVGVATGVVLFEEDTTTCRDGSAHVETEAYRWC